jgi:hypothetical protein
MKTPAIIASLTVVGSIAYAAGSQGTAGKQPPLMPSGSQAHSMQEEMPQARMQMAGGCTQGADKNWFTAVHPLPECPDCYYDNGASGGSYSDLNGDGVQEFLRFPSCTINQVVVSGQAVSGCFAELEEISGSVDACVITRSCVADREMIGNFIKLMYPNTVDAWCGFSYRDLDLLINIALQPQGTTYNKFAWLENTGFEKSPPPLAADLNRDGAVDGVDLGLLLAAWGTNS